MNNNSNSIDVAVLNKLLGIPLDTPAQTIFKESHQSTQNFMAGFEKQVIMTKLHIEKEIQDHLKQKLQIAKSNQSHQISVAKQSQSHSIFCKTQKIPHKLEQFIQKEVDRKLSRCLKESTKLRMGGKLNVVYRPLKIASNEQ